MHTYDQGDIITVVTKKVDKHHGEWTTTRDIRVTFASSRAAKSAYEQQRSQHNNKDTQVKRLLTYTGHVCPVLLPTGHTSEASEDASLHRLHVSCDAFRGHDAGSLLQLFKDSLRDIYGNTINLDGAEAHQRPDDYYTALNDAMEASADQPAVDLDSRTMLYLFEFNKISKTGGINNPYATIEWPGIQIPHAIITNLEGEPLKRSFISEEGTWDEHFITFYERNPAGRGLDFTENPDSKKDFLRYAVEFHCLNRVADTRKSPLPPLEDLAEGVMVQLTTGMKPGTEPGKDLNIALRESGTYQDWFPDREDRHTWTQDMRLNAHLCAGGAMSTGRIQDPERAKTVILSFKTAAGAALAISRQNIKLICFADVTTGRLRVDADATAGGKQDSSAQGRRMILIYKSNMHPGSTLNPEQCTSKADRATRRRWLGTTLKQPDQHQATASPPPEQHYDEEMQEQEHILPHQQGEMPPSGSGAAAPAQVPPQGPNGEPTPVSQG